MVSNLDRYVFYHLDSFDLKIILFETGARIYGNLYYDGEEVEERI